MADVRRGDRRGDSGRGGDRDRGQLFLVGALSLAVLFVVLALLMNTAIYTENIATRGTGSGTDEAIRYGQAVQAGTAGLVGYVNAHHNATNGTLHANMSAGVGTMGDATSVHHAYEGVAADASLVSTTNGTRIVQDNGSRAFTAGNASEDDPDWMLASSVGGTRAFRMNVSRDDLAPDAESAFAVNASNGSNVWRASIYTDDSTVVVDVENGSGTTNQCRAPGEVDYAVVDLTEGAVGGEPCPALDFAENVPAPYSIGFENGDRAAGTYGLVVHGTSLGGEPNDAFYGDATDGSPYVTHAIYSATVRVTYEGPQINYRTNVTVAPEGGR